MKFDIVNSEYNNGILKIISFDITHALIIYDDEFQTWDIIYEWGCKKFSDAILKFLRSKGFKNIRDITKFN